MACFGHGLKGLFALRRTRVHPKGLRLDEIDAHLEAAGVDDRGRLAEMIYGALFRDRLGRLKNVAWGRRKRSICEAFFDDRTLEVVERRPAKDQSVRYVLRLPDGVLVEAVLLWHHGLWTVCVSSQAGCPLACRFCATGEIGWVRDLEAWEIVDQVLVVGRDADVRVSDIVFMGMGEPLLNEDAVFRAASILEEPKGLQISYRRITISTAGIVPAIDRFVADRRSYRLVFSLTSGDPEKRGALMPIQARYGFSDLIAAIRRYAAHSRWRHVTLEYIAIQGVTMGDDDIEALAQNLTGFDYILNVIPFNPIGNELKAPTLDEVRAWTGRLRALDVPVKIRYSGGRDELSGCGQLGRALMDAGDVQPRERNRMV